MNSKRWTERLHSLQVEAPVESFKAGQFGKLALEINGEMVFRPYFFVNAPHERPLEFYFLKTEEPWRRFASIILVHAVRQAVKLTYQDQFRQLLDNHQHHLRVIPFVSREDTDFAIKGRVPEAIKDGRLEAKAGVQLAAEKSQVMICGNPDMVRDTSLVLEERGLKENRRKAPGHITVENYW